MKLLTRYLRKHRLTQAALAERVGCHPSRISHLVNGVKPTPEMAMALERGTDGALKCEQLCGAVHWHRTEDGRVSGYTVPVQAA